MKRHRAIVVGAGISGLLSARVLSDYFREVVVLDKDSGLGSASPRQGTPQSAHLHVLLIKGQELLEDFFPGIGRRIAKRCPQIDWAKDTSWVSPYGKFPQYDSQLKGYSFSRPFLEQLICEQVRKIPNVSFVKGTFEGLILEENRIIGAKYKNQALYELNSEMVVIAGGSQFKTKLFSDAQSVPTVRVPIHLTYVSALLDSVSLSDCRQYYFQMRPPHTTDGGVLCPVEDGKVIATLIHYGSPLEGFRGKAEEFKSLAKKLPEDTFYKAIKNAQLLRSPTSFRMKEMQHRKFSKLKRLPENLAMLGDYVCRLNPVYGQGMTVSMMQAKWLQELMERGKFRTARFQRGVDSLLRVPWILAATGSAEPASGFLPTYLDHFLRRSHHNPKRHESFLNILHMRKSPFSVVDPGAIGNAIGFGGYRD